VDGSSGACGDRIAAIDPRFAPLNALHLSSAETGEPMHALENGFYHFKNHVEKNGGTWADAFRILADYWHVDRLDNKSQRKISQGMPDGVIFDMTKTIVAEEMERYRDTWKKQATEARALAESIPSDLTEAGDFDPDEHDEPEKARALAEHLGVDPSNVDEEGDNQFAATGQEFMVLTDEEADEAQDESLENYIDECLEIPENMKSYFDRDAWKRDARMDGRGHCLSSYDGEEHQGGEFFIYRTN